MLYRNTYYKKYTGSFLSIEDYKQQNPKGEFVNDELDLYEINGKKKIRVGIRISDTFDINIYMRLKTQSYRFMDQFYDIDTQSYLVHKLVKPGPNNIVIRGIAYNTKKGEIWELEPGALWEAKHIQRDTFISMGEGINFGTYNYCIREKSMRSDNMTHIRLQIPAEWINDVVVPFGVTNIARTKRALFFDIFDNPKYNKEKKV